MPEQHCPICNNLVQPSQRYPDYVCTDCERLAVDEQGTQCAYSNVDCSGGFKTSSNSNICFINGIKCYADEAYFGGIVVRPVK